MQAKRWLHKITTSSMEGISGRRHSYLADVCAPGRILSATNIRDFNSFRWLYHTIVEGTWPLDLKHRINQAKTQTWTFTHSLSRSREMRARSRFFPPKQIVFRFGYHGANGKIWKCYDDDEKTPNGIVPSFTYTHNLTFTESASRHPKKLQQQLF